jgi:hypothetical protein
MIRHNGITIDRKTRTISHAGAAYQFRIPMNGCDVAFTSVCHLVLGPGFSLNDLFDLAYSDDADGGPDGGPDQLLCYMNSWPRRFLDRLGIELRAWKISGVTRYCICQADQPQSSLHQPTFKSGSRGRKLPA